MSDPIEHPTAKSLRQSLEMVADDRTACFEELGRAQARLTALEAALLEIFDHECRTSDKSFIACTARDALWHRAALERKKKDE